MKDALMYAVGVTSFVILALMALAFPITLAILLVSQSQEDCRFTGAQRCVVEIEGDKYEIEFLEGIPVDAYNTYR